MAERHPGWVDGVDASEARLATGVLTTAEIVGNALDPLRVRYGLRDASGHPGLVSVAGNKVTVNPFQAVLGDPARPGDGPYLATLDAVKEFSPWTAHQSLSRIDVVTAEVTTTGTGFEVKLYQGEPSGTPARPEITNPVRLDLAEIRVPPAGTQQPTVTDQRRFTSALGGILPVRGEADRPSNAHGSLFVYRLDTRVLEVRRDGEWKPYRPPRGNHEGWQDFVFLNGWANYESGYSKAQYTRTDDNWVRLRGMVKAGTIGRAICNLPGGYRPPARVLFGTLGSGNTIARVDVTNTGDVLAMEGNNSWISLDGIAFATYA